MAPSRTDRERLDDRRKLLTRGRDPTVRNQVRVRINGGKRAGTNERLLPYRRRRGRVLRGTEMKRTQRKDPVGHDEFVHRHIWTGAAAATGDGLPLVQHLRCPE
jgi:hypothetical protein